MLTADSRCLQHRHTNFSLSGRETFYLWILYKAEITSSPFLEQSFVSFESSTKEGYLNCITVNASKNPSKLATWQVSECVLKQKCNGSTSCICCVWQYLVCCRKGNLSIFLCITTIKKSVHAGILYVQIVRVTVVPNASWTCKAAKWNIRILGWRQFCLKENRKFFSGEDIAWVVNVSSAFWGFF